ncbi:MAG: nitroreductase family deazaflavin-dependent oxidoreductase [Chloroflexota bacterium]|nr:nitroreductase family deazaflavin-dependent oxidoreductase [Chloroflexota bacterium]
MDESVRRALARDRLIDITTTGRRSGRPRRIETWFYRSEGRVYLTGLPGRRDWYANLVAHPAFVLHLKESLVADLPARATPITDEAARRMILAPIVAELGRPGELEAWVAGSPLLAVDFGVAADPPAVTDPGADGGGGARS